MNGWNCSTVPPPRESISPCIRGMRLFRGLFLRVAPSRERNFEKSLAMGNCEADGAGAGDIVLLGICMCAEFYEKNVWMIEGSMQGLVASGCICWWDEETSVKSEKRQMSGRWVCWMKNWNEESERKRREGKEKRGERIEAVPFLYAIIPEENSR